MRTHKRLQLLVSLGAVVDDGKVLLARRREPELPHFHGKLELPGGKVEFGELPEQACVREVDEETGYTIQPVAPAPFSMMTRFQRGSIEQQAILLCYAARLVKRERKHVSCAKVSETMWVSPADCEALEVLPGSREFIWWAAGYFGLASPFASTQHFGYVRLESVDENHDRARSYDLTYHVVFGERPAYRIVRKWGRLDASMRLHAASFDNYMDADRAVRLHLARRLRHGYRLLEVSPQFPLKDWVVTVFPKSTRPEQGRLF